MSAYASIRHASAYLDAARPCTAAHAECSRAHTSAYVSIRQHTSAYASIPEGRDCEVALDDGAGDEEASGARIELYIHRRERSVSICTFVPVEQVN
jgi:hypothetical protein